MVSLLRSTAARTRSAAVATAVLFGVLPIWAPPVEAADPAPSSTLAKSVADVTHPGANPVNHGDTLAWTVDYDNVDAGPAAATISDAIAAGQSYVPGSLHVPPGWTPQWSTDGTTFGGNDPGAATRAVRAVNPAARRGGTNRSVLLPPEAKPVATSTGGDGWSPVLFRDENGKFEAWNIYHHGETNPATPKIVCTDLLTGALCDGGPWPKPLNTTAGPFGSGATGNITTALVEEYVMDPAHPGQMFYPAVTPGSVGVGCVDLGARANCGYTALQSTGGSPSSVNGLVGVQAVGPNIYATSTTGAMLCMVMASHAPCAGQPYPAVVAPNGNAPGGNPGNYTGAMTVVANKLFVSSSSAPSTLGCFDPTTNAACVGWAAPKAAGPGGTSTFTAYPDFDSAGRAVGVCSTATGAVTTCYNVDGSARATSAGLAGLPQVGGSLVLNPLTITGPDGHLRSYFPQWGGSLAGATSCVDRTTGDLCAGFPAPATHPTVNGGATREYGHAFDEATGCLYALGDAGVLFSLDPQIGVSPCQRTGGSVELAPKDFYCDGGTRHVRGYVNAVLEGITPANVNLAASRAEVTAPDGTVLATPPIAPNGTIDLSGISPATNPDIKVTVSLVLNSAADFSDGHTPALVANFLGDPPQLCFRTTVATTCTVSEVSNTATGVDATGSLTSNKVTLPVAPGAQCQPKLTIDKQICASSSAYDCGPYGHGPWVKQSPVGLLGLLGTARWRITVTNTGPVGADYVRIYDPAEPSCERAAGTFSLAAGASKQIFCSTHLLVFPFKNTASASFVPTNSPPGTQPTRTGSSSAKACSLLCIL